MPEPKRFRARLAIAFTAVLLVCAGVAFARWRMRPLGDSPAMEFPDVSMSQAEVEQFLDGDFQLIQHMRDLPDPLIQAFTETGGSRLTMADPGESFQVTDNVLDPSLPWKRLVLAGRSGDKSFILYEEGGISHFYVLALFKRGPANALKPISESSCRPAADIAEIRDYVSMGACSRPMPFYSVPHVTDH